MGGDYFALCLALEELGRVDQSVAITLEAGVSPRRDADLPVRHRRAEAGLAAAALLRQGARRVRPDRSGRRLRCRAPPGPPPGSTTANGSSTAPSSSSPTPAPTSPRWSPSPRSPANRPDGTAKEISVDPGARPAPGLHCRAGVQQGRLERLGHPPAELRRRPGPRGEPARRARPRLRQIPAHPRRGPHRYRRAGRRRRPGLRRRMRASTPRSAGVRPADRRATRRSSSRSRTWQARAHTARTRLLRRGRTDAGRASRSRRRRPSPRWSRPRRPWTTPATPPRSSAATGS